MSSIKDKVKSVRPVVPMIYAYTTPQIADHDGWTKIGYTEQGTGKRIAQQTNTADVETHEEWKGQAVYDDGTGDTFTDHDFHAYLTEKLKVERKPGKEWFHVTGPVSHGYFNDFRENRGILTQSSIVVPYSLRKEQSDAVEQAEEYAENHEKGEYLWNCKPRFGKTLSTYDLCKQLKTEKVLIVTNRPAIANSWYDDYVKFLGPQSGYLFVSHVDTLAGKPFVIDNDEYIQQLVNSKNPIEGRIEFVSLQDLKGSDRFGGEFEKLHEVADLEWDILVIDEAHEGVDTYKTDIAFDQIKRKFTLHLSGTPFKAIANDKFQQDAIYNWTYAEEQKAKQDWDNPDLPNPYENLPKLNLFTYQMSEIIKDEIDQGIEINGETEEYAFDLNEFFATDERGYFIHNSSIDRFLDALTTQGKFPFSTDELRNKLKHTFWLLNRVDSAKALMRKLKKHPVFKDYYVVLAAGDGKIDDDEETKKSFDKVREAIKNYDKTITLSVGQLTTGVTIPEWTAVLMLSNIKSPALYMQAAFRAQNPCLFHDKDGKYYRKENAYVFDFDPARTLTVFEKFANDLNIETSDGRGDIDERKDNIRTLLNFFPVLGEDDNGEMVELDAEKVLSVPRKIYAKEVVRRGFMSDFLFANISNVFHAPQEVIDILAKFEPQQEPAPLNIDRDTASNLDLDDNGEVDIPEEKIIGKAADVFGDKIYEDVGAKMEEAIQKGLDENKPNQEDELIENIKKEFHEQAVRPILEKAQEAYQDDLKPAQKNRLEKKLSSDAERELNKRIGAYGIRMKLIDKAHEEAKEDCDTKEEEEKVNQKFEAQRQEAVEELKKTLSDTVNDLIDNSQKHVVEAVETAKQEAAKKTVEDTVRDHLRGFARTIPSFLMGYGDESTTLANFDQMVPPDVFSEVTRNMTTGECVTVEDFRKLRDGFDYTDDNGETQHYPGHLFDEVIFNDSVKEFIGLRTKLADYFDDSQKEDIFDYIPPQKTNQIFTPKKVVRKMVDMLEQENPGCFDQPDKTFADLYMKSGLYITEVVKRLYNSDGLKVAYPDPAARLDHIFAKQVYGLAPTEIIYKIATRYILGFADEVHLSKTNFRCCDALGYAENGTLEDKLMELFPELKD